MGVQPVSTASLIASRRRGTGSSAGVRTTSTSRAMIWRPRPLSITDRPQRVKPGSTPITRTRASQVCRTVVRYLNGRDRRRRGRTRGVNARRGTGVGPAVGNGVLTQPALSAERQRIRGKKRPDRPERHSRAVGRLLETELKSP